MLKTILFFFLTYSLIFAALILWLFLRVKPAHAATPYPAVWVGRASYYSRAGCLGCSKNMRMANGEQLDDSKLTVAFNDAKLGTLLRITNSANGQSVVAETTDRGGFKRHGKIIDLSVATKNAIKCKSTCDVKVEVL